MIVDSSALLVVLARESDADQFQGAILMASPCRMSVANMLEASIVIEGRGGAEAGHELDAFLEHADIEPAPVTTEHLEAARQAWRRFGDGRHPAAMNIGDCFAYVLAQVADEPLLYKGDDFGYP